MFDHHIVLQCNHNVISMIVSIFYLILNFEQIVKMLEKH
jgi:hypothetical protein